MFRLDATRFVLYQTGTLNEDEAGWEEIIPSAELVLSRARYSPSKEQIAADVERSPGSFIVTIVLEEADKYSISGGPV